jgi:hypothetical protein
MITEKKFKVNELVFEKEQDAFDYCESQNISPEDIETIFVKGEEENLSESIEEGDESGEILDETTAKEVEIDVITLDEARKSTVENYDELDETTKKMVLSRLAGQVTGHDQVFRETPTTEDIEKRGAYVKYMLRKIEEGMCPACEVHYSQLSTAQGLHGKTAEELKGELVELHMLSKHKELYEILKEFTSPREEGDTELPSGELMPNQTGAPNPEQCNLENLSRDEIAEMLTKDPDALKRFYKRALDRMQGKE